MPGLPVSVLNMPLTADPVLSKTGSCGWQLKVALHAKVGDEYVEVLGTITLTVKGSKKWTK